jgi:hypothetical protein
VHIQWQIQRGVEGTFAPLKKILKKEREREGGGSSVPLLSISAFIHSPVKCNKSYIFTRCIALLVYLITFELLKQSTINQQTKWYYNPLDIHLIKIHPFYKHFNTNYPIKNFQQRNMRKLDNIACRVFGNSVQASYFERFHWSILNFWTLQTMEHAVPCSVAVMLHGL